jgi:hypothetical protein
MPVGTVMTHAGRAADIETRQILTPDSIRQMPAKPWNQRIIK